MELGSWTFDLAFDSALAPRPEETPGPGASAVEAPKEQPKAGIGTPAKKRPATKVDDSGLVFREKSEPKVHFPAHEGSTELAYAEPYVPYASRRR